MERPVPEENPCCREVELRKQLLLLATLVVGVTYVAGINPPGGVWQENKSGQKAGESILLATYRERYLVFYYGNTTALAASIVVIFLLLLKKPRRGLQLVLLRIVMVLDLLGLIGAYIAGCSQELRTSLYAVILGCILVAYLTLTVWVAIHSPSPQEDEELDNHAPLKLKERRKVLMLLASFMTVITYVAGLSTSGGYWDRVESNKQLWDDALVGLDNQAKVRFRVFLYFNTTTVMSSLLVVMQLLLQKQTAVPTSTHFIRSMVSQPSVPIIGVGVFCLLGAYAAGTYRNTGTNVYVLCLIAAFVAYISLVIVMIGTGWWSLESSSDATTSTTGGDDEQEDPVGSMVVQLGSSTVRSDEAWRKVKSLVLLLATLAATITYQAGLHPPGGVWQDDLNGHRAGYPILWAIQVFLYFNAVAFMLCMDVILLLMLVKKANIHTTVLVSMVADMVILMGAYAAGSWRNATASSYIYVAAMAGGVFVYATIHLSCARVLPRTMKMDYTRLTKKKHKRLLLVGILVSAITYQVGLNPPGGFQHQEGDKEGVGLLMDNYPCHFWVFFYCNTVSFLTSMIVILFFASPNLYKRAVRCYALYGCMVLSLLCVKAAYAAGTVKRVHTYAYVFELLAMVVSVVAVHTIQSRAFLLKEEEGEEDEEDGSSAIFGHAHMPRPRPRPRHIPRPRLRLRSAQETKYRQVYASHKHLVLLGILAASATYQAGLNPPGGLWQDNSNHGDAGSPVMYDTNRRRYLAFFYSNSTSFVASVFIVALQLQQIMLRHEPKHSKLLVLATNTALVLDLLCILAAYTAGATRTMQDTISLVVLMPFCVAIHAASVIRQEFQYSHDDQEP